MSDTRLRVDGFLRRDGVVSGEDTGGGADSVDEANGNDARGFDAAREVDAVDVAGCFGDFLVVVAHGIGFEKLRPTVDAVCGEASVVAHSGNACCEEGDA